VRGLAGLALGACAALVLACGAARNAQAPTARATTPEPGAAADAAGASTAPMPGDPHGEIEALDARIAAERDRMGLPAPQVAAVVPGTEPPTMMAVPSVAGDAACHPAPSTTCQDSCTLADSICANAGRICELASELPGDDWAAQKCVSGKATCDAAHARCCGCQS